MIANATEIMSNNASSITKLVDSTGSGLGGTTSPQTLATVHPHQLTAEDINPEDGNPLYDLQRPRHYTVSDRTDINDLTDVDRAQKSESLRAEHENYPGKVNKSAHRYNMKEEDTAAHAAQSTPDPAGGKEGHLEKTELLEVTKNINSEHHTTEVPKQYDESLPYDPPVSQEPPHNSVSDSGKTYEPEHEEALQETDMPFVSTETPTETNERNEGQYSEVEKNTALQTDTDTETLRQERVPERSRTQENVTSEVENDLTDSGLIRIDTTTSETVVEGSGMESDKSSYVTTARSSSREPKKEDITLASGCTPALCWDIMRANITATPMSAKAEGGSEVQFTCMQAADLNETGRWFRLRWLGQDGTVGSFEERPDGRGGRSRVLVGRVIDAKEMNFTCVPDVPTACCSDVGVTVTLVVYDPPVYTMHMAIVGGLVLLSAVTCLLIYATHRKKYQLVSSSDKADPEWQYVR